MSVGWEGVVVLWGRAVGWKLAGECVMRVQAFRDMGGRSLVLSGTGQRGRRWQTCCGLRWQNVAVFGVGLLRSSEADWCGLRWQTVAAVLYRHLTLPTNHSVEISGVGDGLKKKKEHQSRRRRA